MIFLKEALLIVKVAVNVLLLYPSLVKSALAVYVPMSIWVSLPVYVIWVPSGAPLTSSKIWDSPS